MLTSRGWLFLLFAAALLAWAVLVHLATLAILALALILWFAWEWLLFAVRSRIVVRQVELLRQVSDERGPVDSLWAGRTFTVDVELRLNERLGLSYAAVVDRVPFGAELVDGSVRTDGALRRDEPLRLRYRMRCPIVGRLRFEGVKVRLADLQGFFHVTTFHQGVLVYRVLPRLSDASGRPATKKRTNLLPPPGIHRLRRPGSGSELLDLRDYLPGDPPKTIAWKVSARRDRLITKDFESEVPIRCTLFVDASNSVRVGPPGEHALGRLVEIAAAVTQANAADRDLTGLCLFDECQALPLRPARGPRHLIDMLNRLVDAASRPPAAGETPLVPLLRLAHAFAEEVYPEMLHRDLNSVPFWLPWVARRQKTTDSSSFLGRMILYFIVIFFPSMIFLGMQSLIWGQMNTAAIAIGLPVSLVLAALIFFWPRDAKLVRWRKRLAALLSVRYGLAPGGLALFLENDEQMSHYLQRFLADHHVPYALPLYDAKGRYRFASPEKVQILAAALLRSVGRGHDNELFVLLADLLEVGDRLEPLLRAVRVALARHHQVVVICPWPRGLPPPREESTLVRLATGTDVRAILDRTVTARFHRAYHKLRRTFARLGVSVVSARSEEPVPLILERMDRLRMLGRRR
jgi:uncharacterized protein (DUF58 family)